MEGELQQGFGRNIRAYRTRLGLSQEAFAKRLGFHRTYMSGIERGQRNLTMRGAERVAGRVGLDAITLLDPAFDADAAPPPKFSRPR